jgi:hypothetical protein
VATVKALACELPARREPPLSRYSTADLARYIDAQAGAPAMSASTIWRILDADARKPWRHRSWLTPRDPQFAPKAGRVLDLYHGVWEGQPLSPADCVLSADEKTSSQARVRRRATTPPRPGQPMRVEHEYARGGASGRCDTTTGIAPFGDLVALVMRQEPYRPAPRVFWVVDNGSSHRGAKAARRLQDRSPNLVLVHLPPHASWLNQIEVYFSIVQRTVLTPNDSPDLAAVETRLRAFAARDNDTAVPFHWRFTRQQLEARLAALPDLPPPIAEATAGPLAA